MLKAISYKTNQFLLVLIKLGLVVGAFYFIYQKLIQNKAFQFDDFVHTLTNFNIISSFAILFLLLLSFMNWFFEIIKWQMLVATIYKLSFSQAKAQTLGALTAALVTPNRIGEYGAKALHYQPQLRKKIVMLNVLGNSAQMCITMIIGSVGIGYFIYYYQPGLNYRGLAIGFSIILVLMGVGFFTVKSTRFWKKKKSVNRLLYFLKIFSKKTISKIMILSLLRYLIFSFQFYYILSLFGVNLGYLQAMMAISTMYLLASIIPSVFIFDVIIKGGVAVYVFGLMGVSESIILAVVSFMLVFNFVLPSIIGSYYVLQFKLPKTVS